jgi:putative endonuclease
MRETAGSLGIRGGSLLFLRRCAAALMLSILSPSHQQVRGGTSYGRRTLRQYYVYIMTNGSRTLYTGVTNDLRRRVLEHKQKRTPGFAQRYNITQLVYYEATLDVRTAIAREKQIKGWLRSKKVALIESTNPEWHDLSDDWET